MQVVACVIINELELAQTSTEVLISPHSVTCTQYRTGHVRVYVCVCVAFVILL